MYCHHLRHLRFHAVSSRARTVCICAQFNSRIENICNAVPSSFGRLNKITNTSLHFIRPVGTKETKSTMSVPRSDTVKSPFVVGHDLNQKMFYVELQDKSKNKDGSVAKLEYELVRPGLVDLHHTETPPAFQGQGIAKLLVIAALDHFCEEDVLIRPTCTYVQKVLRENLTSLYKDHVEESYLSSL